MASLTWEPVKRQRLHRISGTFDTCGIGFSEFGDTELSISAWSTLVEIGHAHPELQVMLKFVMNGVDHTSNHNQGWISMLLATVRSVICVSTSGLATVT